MPANGFTSAPIASAPASVIPTLPEFVRLPKAGHQCPWTGLSRSGLNELILPCAANGGHPPVKSVCLRKKGAVTGVRLIVLASLLDYLRAQTTEGGAS